MSKEYTINITYSFVGIFFIYIFLVILIHFSNIKYLIDVDWARNDFDYCIMIPFVVSFLFFKKRYEIIKCPSVQSWFGLLIVLLGGILTIFGELGGEYLLSYISLWLLIVGFFVIVWGVKKVNKVFFAFLLLLTMFPPPSYVYSRITLKMQILSSVFAEKILQFIGIAAFREGNIIDVGTTKIQVVAACSGLRYLIPIFIVAVIMVFLMNTNFKKRKLFLVFVSLPLAIIMNGLRLAFTGYLAKEYGTWAIEGVYHDLIGWVFFGISIVILFVFMTLLDSQEYSTTLQKKIKFLFSWNTSTHFLKNNLIVYLSICFLVLLYIFINFQKTHHKAYVIDNALTAFPLNIGNWSGKRSSIPQSTLNELDSSDYALIDYANILGEQVNFYSIYYANQTKGKSIHSPETCLRGGGWRFVKSDQVQIFKDFYVNRSILSNNDRQILSYFWFTCRGRNLTNALELKFYNFWDRLISGRSDGALIRIITPISNGDVKSADSRMANFMQYLIPVINDYFDDMT